MSYDSENEGASPADNNIELALMADALISKLGAMIKDLETKMEKDSDRIAQEAIGKAMGNHQQKNNEH